MGGNGGQDANAGKLVFWFCMLFISSLTMIVGNKAVMLSYHYPNVLMLMQNGVTVAFLTGNLLMGSMETKKFTSQQFKVFAVTALCLATQIGSSFMALALVPIATTVAFRNLCTAAIAIIECMFFGVKINLASGAGLGCVILGMTIYAGTDYSFNATGYFWLTVNSVATVTSTIWQRVFVKRFTSGENSIQTPNGVTLIIQTETIPIAMAMASINGEFATAAADLWKLPTSVLGLIMLTCAGGILIGMAYTNCFALASGTQVVVASTANKAIAIVIGMYAFGTVLTASQCLGLVICVGGALAYGVEQKKQREGKSLCDSFTGQGVASAGKSVLPE